LPEREPQLAEIPIFLAEMQSRQFDLVVQLHGSGTIVNSLVALLGGRRSTGFYPPGYYCPDPASFVPWPERGLEIHRLLALVDHLGLPRFGDELELPLAAEDFSKLDAILEAQRPFVVVHPGASTPSRQWPVAWFAAVARRLEGAGFRTVITGVASEQPLAGELAGRLEQRAIDLCGRTDLGTLGALVSRAALVISNDTGISHVAAALQTPSVVISTGENPARWSPINRRLHRVLCHPAGVGVDEVLEAALEQVRLRTGARSASATCELAPMLG
jgi:ADP-heptose:LPS heptosyltransferase